MTVAMTVERYTVEKLLIRNAPVSDGLGTLDPVSVIVEDFGPGAGKITITCFGEAWSNYWGSMGEQHTLMSFFLKCDSDYLVRKLKGGIEHEIRYLDAERMEKDLKAEIVRLRRQDDLTHEQAREYWNDACGVGVDESDYSGIYADVFGDEWWYRLPRKPNPDYEYLTRIVQAVKAGFKQLQEQPA